MLPLMHLTWIINRRLLLQFSPWLAFYLWLFLRAQAGTDPVQPGLVLVFFVLLVTAIVTFQGLLLPVEEFILSLPVSRSQVVRAKYLSSLLGLAAGLGLPLLAALVAHAVAPGWVPAIRQDELAIGALAALFLAFGVGLFLPFVYHFGPARGLSIFAVTLVLALAGALAWKGRGGCLQALLDFGNRVFSQRGFAAAVILGVVLFGLASLAFSVWTYRRARHF